MANLEITLKRSLIGSTQRQIKTIKSLGLKKINSKAVHPDNDAVRGAIKQISHLVEVKEV